MGVGYSKAESIIRSTVEQAVSVCLQNSGSCSTSSTSSNLINLENTSGIDMRNIDLNNSATINSACVINQTNSAAVSQAVSEMMSQSADSMSSGIGLNASDTLAVTELMTKLAVDVKQSVEAAVKTSVNSENAIKIKNSTNVIMANMTLSNWTDLVSQAAISQVMSSTTAQSLIQTVENSSSSEAKGRTTMSSTMSV